MSFWTSPLMHKLRSGVAATLSQTEPYLRAWAEANERARLEARDGRDWRVINLSRTGSCIRDVVAEQIPALAPLALEAELVTCAAGANDLRSLWFRPVPDELRSLVSGLPPGSVLATLPQGLGRRRAQRLNEIIRTEAPLRQLRIGDVWARTGPPWKGKFAADDFHPNEIGHREWCDAFAEASGVPVA